MKVHFDGFEDETQPQPQNWEALNGNVQNGEAADDKAQNVKPQKEEPKTEPLNDIPQIVEPPKKEATTVQPQTREAEVATEKAQIAVEPSGTSNVIAPAGEHAKGEAAKEEDAQVLTRIGWCRVPEVTSEEPEENGEAQDAETSTI